MPEQYAIGGSVPVHKQAELAPISTREELAGLDTSRYEWVEVPTEDIFGRPHTGVSINFITFGPGRHFVDPERAAEVRRLLAMRQASDIRVLRPNVDRKMEEIMARQGKPSQANTNF